MSWDVIGCSFGSCLHPVCGSHSGICSHSSLRHHLNKPYKHIQRPTTHILPSPSTTPRCRDVARLTQSEASHTDGFVQKIQLGLLVGEVPRITLFRSEEPLSEGRLLCHLHHDVMKKPGPVLKDVLSAQYILWPSISMNQLFKT